MERTIRALEEHPDEKAKATITVTLTLTKLSDRLDIKPDVKVKLPEEKGILRPPSGRWKAALCRAPQPGRHVRRPPAPPRAPRQRTHVRPDPSLQHQEDRSMTDDTSAPETGDQPKASCAFELHIDHLTGISTRAPLSRLVQ